MKARGVCRHFGLQYIPSVHAHTPVCACSFSHSTIRMGKLDTIFSVSFENRRRPIPRHRHL